MCISIPCPNCLFKSHGDVLGQPRVHLPNTCFRRESSSLRIIFEYAAVTSINVKDNITRLIFLDFVPLLNLKPAHEFFGPPWWANLKTINYPSLVAKRILIYRNTLNTLEGFVSLSFLHFHPWPCIAHIIWDKPVKHELRFNHFASIEQDKM